MAKKHKKKKRKKNEKYKKTRNGNNGSYHNNKSLIPLAQAAIHLGSMFSYHCLHVFRRKIGATMSWCLAIEVALLSDTMYLNYTPAANLNLTSQLLFRNNLIFFFFACICLLVCVRLWLFRPCGIRWKPRRKLTMATT